MILVDTSVWADHLRKSEPHLQQLLNKTSVVMHPMVIGELACGYLTSRAEWLLLWRCLPQTIEASHQEVIQFIGQNQHMGKGIGFVDFHLLASCLLDGNTQLWTRDKRLQKIAEDLQIAYSY